VKISRKPSIIGCLLGAAAAVVVTTLIQGAVCFIDLKGELGWIIYLFSAVFIRGPAYVISDWCGWEWHDSTACTALGFCSMLLVNSILGAALGTVFGYCTGCIFKSRIGSIVGSSSCFVFGVTLIIAGFNNNDGLWLKNWGAFFVLLCGVILFLYPVIARKRSERARPQSIQS